MILGKRLGFIIIVLFVVSGPLIKPCYGGGFDCAYPEPGGQCGFNGDKPDHYKVTVSGVQWCDGLSEEMKEALDATYNGCHMLSRQGCQWRNGPVILSVVDDGSGIIVSATARGNFTTGYWPGGPLGPFPAGGAPSIYTPGPCCHVCEPEWPCPQGCHGKGYGGTITWAPIYDCEGPCDDCDPDPPCEWVVTTTKTADTIHYVNMSSCPKPRDNARGDLAWVTISATCATHVIANYSGGSGLVEVLACYPPRGECSSGSQASFLVQALRGDGNARSAITFSAQFLNVSNGTQMSGSATIKIVPSYAECSDFVLNPSVMASGSSTSASVGNTSVSIFAGTNPVEQFSYVEFYDYNDGEVSRQDIAVKLPDKTQAHILSSPSGIMPGWSAEMDDSNTVTVTSPDNLKYIYPEPNDYMLVAIRNVSDVNLVIFDYNDTDANLLDYQIDAFDPNLYIEYAYDVNGLLDTITLWDYNDNRTYTIIYDANDRVIATSGSCSSCGGGGVKYEYDDANRIQYVKDANDTVIYEYAYDTKGRIIDKYLGEANDGNHIQELEYLDYYDSSYREDIYDYINPTEYRVTREYKTSAGFVTERIKYKNLNEYAYAPFGESYTEYTVYFYDANDIITKKVVIPPLGNYSDPNDPNTIAGIRKEYTYDPNIGRILAEKWFDANDVNFTVSSYTYEYIIDDGNIVDSRVKTFTDGRGAVTEYVYTDANDTNPYRKFMPQVTTGISGTLQLKYEYQYDSQNRVILEKQLDDSNSVIVQTKYEYDNYGNLVKRYDDYGDSNELTEYEYNGFNEMVKMTLPTGVTQGWSYNDVGKVESEFVYDSCDPNYICSQTDYFYDKNGRVEKIARAKDSDTFFINDPNQWIWTRYEYDLQGNKTRVIEDANGLALETLYEYNFQNEVEKVTLPNGKWTKTVRDGRGLVDYTQVGYGSTTEATTSFEYDGNGNLVKQTSVKGIGTKYVYDDFDRLIKVTKGL